MPIIGLAIFSQPFQFNIINTLPLNLTIVENEPQFLKN